MNLYFHPGNGKSTTTAQVQYGSKFYPLKVVAHPTWDHYRFMGWARWGASKNLYGDTMAARWDLGRPNVYAVGRDDDNTYTSGGNSNWYAVWVPDGNIYRKQSTCTTNQGYYNGLALCPVYVYHNGKFENTVGAGVTNKTTPETNTKGVPYPTNFPGGTASPEFFFTNS